MLHSKVATQKQQHLFPSTVLNLTEYIYKFIAHFHLTKSSTQYERQQVVVYKKLYFLLDLGLLHTR